MVKSMFAGVSGLRAHQSKMDVIGNNIANVNTYSFKTGRATFKDAYYSTMTAASGAGGGYGGGNPSQVGYGSQIGSVDVVYTPGSYAPTDRPMDAMINGNGYFMTGTIKTDDTGKVLAADKPSDLNLTRVGIFNFDEEGYLVDANRNYVYGYQATYDADSKEYVLPEPDADGKIPLTPIKKQNALEADGTEVDPPKMMDFTSISIGADGKINGMYNGKSILVGQIAVANVPNQEALQAMGGSYYKAVTNTGEVTANAPGAGGTAQLKTGGLEMANVDLAKEFSDMITTQRGFQANTRIITVSDEMLQELVNLKR